MRRLAAGDMRHVVTIRQHKIEAGTTALDTYGQLSASSTAWTNTITRRAKIEQLSGDEALIARQLYPHASYKVTLDYDETIASTGGSRRLVSFNNRSLFIGRSEEGRVGKECRS